MAEFCAIAELARQHGVDVGPCSIYTRFRDDGWPYCPVCDEDELWSPATPATIETIVGCYRGCFKRLPYDPETGRTASYSDVVYVPALLVPPGELERFKFGASRLDDRFADRTCPDCSSGFEDMGSDECCPTCLGTRRVAITEAERWTIKRPGDVTDFTVAAYYDSATLRDRLTVKAERPCRTCDGEGFVWEFPSDRAYGQLPACPDCGPYAFDLTGTGTETSDQACPRHLKLAMEDCDHCDGEGIVTLNPSWPDPRGESDVKCSRCSGSGFTLSLPGLDEKRRFAVELGFGKVTA